GRCGRRGGRGAGDRGDEDGAGAEGSARRRDRRSAGAGRRFRGRRRGTGPAGGMTMKTVRLLAATLLLLALSGCSMTVFESLPTGETTRCDPAWPGHWAQVKSMSGKASEGSPEVIEIDATCSKSGKPGDTEPAPLLLVTTP